MFVPASHWWLAASESLNGFGFSVGRILEHVPNDDRVYDLRPKGYCIQVLKSKTCHKMRWNVPDNLENIVT